MQLPADRRTLYLVIGAAVAVLAGAVIAVALLRGGEGDADTAPPASQGGLVVDSSSVEDGNLDPAQRLKCFVAGQVVGELTLAECAERNGVGSGALDVGLDETGALSATGDPNGALTPLPPEQAAPVEPPPIAQGPSYDGVAPAGACWRYEGRWTRLPGDLTLSDCAQVLFDGRCETRGKPIYGRWMQQTLRLTYDQVDISGDNRNFRPLVEQVGSCSVPPL